MNQTVEQRFWSKVDIAAPTTAGCGPVLQTETGTGASIPLRQEVYLLVDSDQARLDQIVVEVELPVAPRLVWDALRLDLFAQCVVGQEVYTDENDEVVTVIEADLDDNQR